MILTIIIISWLLVGFFGCIVKAKYLQEVLRLHDMLLMILGVIVWLALLGTYIFISINWKKPLFDFTKKEDKLRDIRFKGDTK